MKTSIASAAALICVLTACGGGGDTAADKTSSPTSAATSEADSSTETTTADAAADAAAEPDYSTLLMAAEDLDAPVPFIADAPQPNGDGVPGVTQTFRVEGNGAVIVDTLIVCEDAAQAEAVLTETVKTLGQSVVGEPQPWPLAPNGTIVTGTTLDGSSAITAVLFTEDNVLTTLEFNSQPGDLEPAPPTSSIPPANCRSMPSGRGCPNCRGEDTRYGRKVHSQAPPARTISPRVTTSRAGPTSMTKVNAWSG